MTTIYVGNLSWDTTDIALRELFAGEGNAVTNVVVKKNATTGKPRGFAFVEVATPEEAQEAIRRFNGALMNGRAIRVGSAKELPIRNPDNDRDSSNYRYEMPRGQRRFGRRS